MNRNSFVQNIYTSDINICNVVERTHVSRLKNGRFSPCCVCALFDRTEAQVILQRDFYILTFTVELVSHVRVNTPELVPL